MPVEPEISTLKDETSLCATFPWATGAAAETAERKWKSTAPARQYGEPRLGSSTRVGGSGPVSGKTVSQDLVAGVGS